VKAANNEKLLNTLRLLYVEDDREALEELAHFLKKRVASLAVATNGLEALEHCQRQTFDAILCDLWMPHMDGFTFIQTLREAGVQTPVIITSAFSDLDTILKAIDLGIVKYCVKPIEADELLDSLSRIALDKLTASGEAALPGNRLMDRQQRLEAEKALKSGFAHLLKSLTGKGPREVHVSLGTGDVEIWATDVQSPIETSLRGLAEHAGMVPYLRKSLYTGYKNRFEALIKDHLDADGSLTDIRIMAEENTDWLVFKLL
jgi:CheY-like chemotaxis protein